MRRGPKPKPTKLKLMAGNPGRHPLNDREPQPETGEPDCPEWVDGLAAEKWAEMAPALDAIGVLSKIDGDALTCYCQTWARWRQAEEFIMRHGPVLAIKNDDGTLKYMQQIPQVSIARSLVLVLNRYQIEFGLTPSSRSRVKATPKAVEKPKQRFFKGGA